MMSEQGLRELDLSLNDGRTLHVYDRMPATTSPSSTAPLVVFWQHGTPNLGAPPAPLFATADRLGLRWVSFDRPGYGRSTPNPGRTLAAVASDLAEVADALRIDRFAVIGQSGGGTHALACGAALPDRVLAVVSMAGLAPYGVPDLDWFAGMVPSGKASLRAALGGRAAKEAHQAADDAYDPEFTEADEAALGADWSWLLTVVEPALDSGPDGLIDDDLAYVTSWGCDPSLIAAPVLLMHGQQDSVVSAAHSEWLGRHCPGARLQTYPDDGHISVLNHAEEALQWLTRVADERPGTSSSEGR